MSRSFAESDTARRSLAGNRQDIVSFVTLGQAREAVRVSCAAAPERPTVAQRRAFPLTSVLYSRRKRFEGSDEAADFELSFSQMVSSTKLTKTPVSRK
jgi:hypothetical protein